MTVGQCKSKFTHADRKQTLHLEPDQLGRQVGEPLFPPLRIAVLNDEVLALDIAEVAQPLPEGFQTWIGLPGRARTEPTDPVHFPRWLCVSDKRRREDTEGEGDNDPYGAAPHDRLLGSASCRLSSFHGSLTLGVSRCRKRERRRSGRWRQSAGRLG